MSCLARATINGYLNVRILGDGIPTVVFLVTIESRSSAPSAAICKSKLKTKEEK